MAALVIAGTGIAEWAPGSLLVSVSNGGSNLVGTITVDAVATGQTFTLGPSGLVSNLTVMLLDPLSIGGHTLGITTSADSGTMDFEVQRNGASPTSSSSSASPSPQEHLNRWQFEDPVTTEIYVLPINPTSASVPYPARQLADRQTTTGRFLTAEGNSRSVVWTLEGYIETEGQYDAFLDWSKKPYRLFITDDFGRQFVGLMLEFAPTPLAPQHSGGFFSRSRYTLTIEVLGEA
jgi:hypothetical protein